MVCDENGIVKVDDTTVEDRAAIEFAREMATRFSASPDDCRRSSRSSRYGGSPYQRAKVVHTATTGLQKGDRILSMDAVPVQSLEEFRVGCQGMPGSLLSIVYVRPKDGGKEKKMTLYRTVRPDGTCWLQPAEVSKNNCYTEQKTKYTLGVVVRHLEVLPIFHPMFCANPLLTYVGRVVYAAGEGEDVDGKQVH